MTHAPTPQPTATVHMHGLPFAKRSTLPSWMRGALFAGLVTALSSAGAVFAQPQEGGEGASAECHGPRHGAEGKRHHKKGMRHGHGMRRILKQLDLTDAQRAEIREIMQSARAEHRATRGRGGEGRLARKEARFETMQRVREVLTPEQRTKAEALMAQQAERHVERRVNHMQRALELSDAQVAQVRGILKRAQQQKKALHQRALTENRPPEREAMQAVRQETHDMIRAVLTDVQRQKFDARRAERRERRGHHGRQGHGHGRGPAQ